MKNSICRSRSATAFCLAMLALSLQVRVACAAEAELIPNPSGRVPLAAALTFKGDAGLESSLTITDGTHSWSASFGDEVRNAGYYEIPVVGMRAGREHRISLSVTGANTAFEQTFSYTTPALSIDPRETPPIDTMVSEPERMEPGVLFLSVRRRALGRPHWHSAKQRDFSMNWGRVIALDPEGEIIWFYESEFRTAGIDRLSNGNILMHRTDSSTLEIDLLGNTVRQFYAEERPHPAPDDRNAIPIKGQQTLHHQPHVLPNGNLLAFSANAYKIENWHSSETDLSAPRRDQMVMADTVVEFTPAGDKVWSWNSMDYLHTERIGYDTFWSYWWVRNFPEHMDWTHANGLSWDASDDSILVSFRNQSAIVKIDYATKDIKWILGRHDGWPERLQNKLLKPVGDLMWPGYQHNPRMTHAGTVILFDNRAHSGKMPGEEPLPHVENFSRGVEYLVDEEAMTVRQIWSSGDEQGEDPCYTNAMSDAWRLPRTNNRLVIHAFCTPLMEGLGHDSMDHTRRYTSDLPSGPRILEFTEDKDIVFRAEIHDPHDLQQWEAYGGFKSPSIYESGSSH